MSVYVKTSTLQFDDKECVFIIWHGRQLVDVDGTGALEKLVNIVRRGFRRPVPDVDVEVLSHGTYDQKKWEPHRLRVSFIS